MADLPIDDTIDVNITNDAGNKKVTVTTDASKERLDVDAKLSASDLTFQLSAFTPKLDFDSTGISLNTSTWDTLIDITSTEGKIDFIVASSPTSSNYRVRLTVDSVEIFDLAMSDLSSLGLSNATNTEIWAETADKNLRYRPNIPVDFTTGFKFEAKATSATPTLRHLIMHREIV